MAQHGYLREYDEDWERGENRRDGVHERSARDDDRTRRRDGQGPRDDRAAPNRHFGSGGRESNFILGDPSGDERGHSAGERARSSFRDDDLEYGASHEGQWGHRPDDRTDGYRRGQGYGGFQDDVVLSSGRSQGRFGRRDEWERPAPNFNSHQDDHYRSWRERQMSALDRDYEEYCREREQQFHRDFESWRQERQNQRPSSGGQASGSSRQQPQREDERRQVQQESSDDVLELNHPTDVSAGPQGGPRPSADSPVDTNDSEDTGVGSRF